MEIFMLNVANKKTWNEEAVLQTGMKFLNKKLIKPSLLRGLWREAMDSFNLREVLDCNPLKVCQLEQIRNEIKILNKNAKIFFNIKTLQNPSSKETEQLKKITMASDYALEYLKQFENEAHLATVWEFVTKIIWFSTLTSLAVAVSGAFGVRDYAKAVTGSSIDFESIVDCAEYFYFVQSATYLFVTKIFPGNNVVDYKKLDRLYETFRNALQLPEKIAILSEEE
jgi:hypothetical protein